MRYELADDFYMATLSTAGAVPVARFQLLNEEDLAALLDQADSKNTKRQVKHAVSIFEEYCSTSGDEIEKLTDAELISCQDSILGLVTLTNQANLQQKNIASNSLWPSKAF